jgi:hypothetical protein
MSSSDRGYSTMKTIQNQPICLCRVCNQPMDVVVQPALMEGRQDMLLVTCDNDECPMWQYTFSDRNYPTVDLNQYMGVRGG